MRTHKTFTVKYRRKREGKTDYKKRLKLILSGKPRLVVRKSLNSIVAQIITFGEKGDKVIVSVLSNNLKKFGWEYSGGNLPSAYLVGLLVASKAKEKGINEAILDIGLNKSVPGSRLFAVLKGAVDNGLKIPHSESILPKEERVIGKHIEEYAKKLQSNPEEFSKKFGSYIKKNCDPLQITKETEKVKNQIIGT